MNSIQSSGPRLIETSMMTTCYCVLTHGRSVILYPSASRHHASCGCWHLSGHGRGSGGVARSNEAGEAGRPCCHRSCRHAALWRRRPRGPRRMARVCTSCAQCHGNDKIFVSLCVKKSSATEGEQGPTERGGRGSAWRGARAARAARQSVTKM